MKRLFCGSVVFAATLVLVSCSDDPTEAFRGTPARLVVDPSSIFLDQSDDAAVVARVEDDQGDPLPAPDMEVTAVGNGITVERNPNFLGTTVGAPLESEQQFVITAGPELLPTSFTVTAAGFSVEVPVRVMPTDLPATFSNLTPGQNEVLTLSVEGFTFLPDATVTFGPNEAFILANDGTTLTFLTAPGSVGPAEVEGVAVNFLPTTPLTLNTLETITADTLGTVPGSDSPATAPAMIVPAAGFTSAFFDRPDFTASPTHFYQFVVTEAGDYTITMDWSVGDDLDLVVCNADLSVCDGQAAAANHPEEGTYSLTPGTYIVISDDFGQNPVCPSVSTACAPAFGSSLTFTVQHDPPPAPPGVRAQPQASGKKGPWAWMKK